MIHPVLSALAGLTRLSAIRMIRGGSQLCVCDMMRAVVGMQSWMTRHIQVLRQSGLVVDGRDAQRVLHRLHPHLPENVRIQIDAAMAEEVAA